MGNTKQYATLVTAGEVIDKTFTNKKNMVTHVANVHE